MERYIASNFLLTLHSDYNSDRRITDRVVLPTTKASSTLSVLHRYRYVAEVYR